MNNNNIESNFKKSILITLITFSLVIFISFLIIEKFFIESEFKKEVLNSIGFDVEKKERYLVKLIDETKNSLIDISRLKIFQESIESGKFNELKNIFFTISQSNIYFMQLRFIDENGKEIVRVDRVSDSNTPYLVKEDKLQDKSLRDYFIESKNKKSFYISNLDLNIENKKIEFPFKPTLRIILPIIQNNQFKGELIANLEVSTFLDIPFFDLMICDSNGKVILPFDKTKKEFKKELKYYFPKEFQTILSNKKFVSGEYISYKLDIDMKNSVFVLFKLKNEFIKEFEKDQFKMKSLVFGIFFLLLILVLFVVFKKINRIFYFHYSNKLKEKIKYSNKEFKSANRLISKNIDPELILSQSSTSMILTNEKIEILFVNKAFTKLFGYEESEVLGKDPGFLRNEDIEQIGIDRLRESLKNNKSVTVIVRNYTKDNKLKYIELSISPIYKENSDRISYYLCIQKDVTREQNILKELKSIF